MCIRDSPKTNDAKKLKGDLKPILAGNPLFGILPEMEIDHLEGYFSKREIRAGERLYRQQNEGTSMFVLAEGLMHSVTSYPDQSDQIVEAIQPGEHFGEECVLGPNGRSSTVSAKTDCLAFEISADKIMEFARKNGAFMTALNTEMGMNRFREMEKKHQTIRGNLSREMESKKPSKGVGSAIQTFFTDFFPQSQQLNEKKK